VGDIYLDENVYGAVTSVSLEAPIPVYEVHEKRHNPLLEQEGKNPFTLDSKEPDWSKFQDFLQSEVRYTSLIKTFPDQAEILFKAAEENAKWRYKSYQRLAAMVYEPETKE
jgi:pyruvate-ferredoxin/flavodoxin oxidoreductase